MEQIDYLKKLTIAYGVTIKQGDKVGNIVMMINNMNLYETMCMKILNNTEWYRRVEVEFINACNAEFTDLVVQAYYNDFDK